MVVVVVAAVLEIVVGLSTSTASDPLLTILHIADSWDDRRNAEPFCLDPPPSSMDNAADAGSDAEGAGDDCVGLSDAEVDVLVVHHQQFLRPPHHTPFWWAL